MNSLSDILERVRSVEPERLLGLRPPYPPVALELHAHGATLVRLKRRRRGRPLLEARQLGALGEAAVPASIFQPIGATNGALTERIRALFEASGTRPGRISLVLPDNVAKISLLTLPEWPGSRKQLEQILRFNTRRSVPFRLDDARMGYQVLHGAGKGVVVLVALMRRALVERYEQALHAVGARVGLVDLCTPNLLNLCGRELEQGGDTALLNCGHNYFSLVILRGGKLIFYRCKTLGLGEETPIDPGGVLAREMINSLSYYQEKLDGEKLDTLLVRSVEMPFEQIANRLSGLGVGAIRPFDPMQAIESPADKPIDPVEAQSIAGALGAASGR